jgi:hypothetical protein
MTMTLSSKPQIIEKESIPSLFFPSSSVDRTKEDLKVLVRKLRRSMMLGNVYRTKMRIQFEDEDGLKEVRTTIWAVGDRNIVLKKGVLIPINRVVDVIL